MLPNIRRIACDPAHIVGHVPLDPWEDEPQSAVVDGMYDMSTIEVNGRRETVAFKVSGVGPNQIEAPQFRKTITITQHRTT